MKIHVKDKTIADFKELFLKLNYAKRMCYYIKIKERFEKADNSETTLQLGYILKWIEKEIIVPKYIIKL